MILSRVEYSQHIDERDEWFLQGLKFGKLNLITSRNAVGKTRTCNVITHLAEMLSGKVPGLKTGNFDFVFRYDKGLFKYQLRTGENQVHKERIVNKGAVLVNRKSDKGRITYFRGNKRVSQDFHPPKNKLTIQIRRDLKELPYLEALAYWAENLHSITFSKIFPGGIPVIFGHDVPLNLITSDLSLAPFMLKELLNNNQTKKKILNDIKHVGYDITDIDVSIPYVPNPPKDSLVIELQEKGIRHPIDQLVFSQGMYRVITIIIAVNYLLEKGIKSTLIVDDFGEGLDFERAARLTKVVFKRVKGSKAQLILTSNERFLLNAVDIKYWNILERKGHKVKAFNYSNSKRLFDEFTDVGLNNFDFFANQLYKE